MSSETNNLNQCLRAVWQRSQRKQALGGLLAFARWFVPLFVVAAIIDRYAFLSGWLRALVALSLLALSLRQAWRHGWRRLQGFQATRVAQQIERASGGMDSLLVTAVQFEQSGAAPGTSAAMWELTARKAQEAAAEVQPGEVIRMSDLRKPLRVAAAVLAVLLGIAVFNGSFLAAGLGRMFTPWLAIAYPTDTKIDLGEGELVVKEGAPATIEIKLSGEIPETAELSLRTGEGRPREIELEVVNGVCAYELASASRDFSFRVKAGDARSDWRDVRVIMAPRMERVRVALDFPSYIERETETVEALTLTVPEETEVGWTVTLDTRIRQATLHRDGEDDLPLAIGKDGRTLTLAETATASRGYHFSWVEDGHGFDFTSPRYFLQVASDQAPRVELTKPESNLNAMLGRPLSLAIRAQDDHGIGTTTITYRVNRRPEKVIVLDQPVNGGGEQVLDWDYRKELPDLQVGDSVSFVVEVADKYPGEGGPHKVRTETRRISFLSREDYLAEITKQMERLLTRVRTLYRQERAAHELVLGLDPSADSYLPTCQLEAIRQEMVREQLSTTADEVQALLDDLAANQVSDAVESDLLALVRDELRAIATQDVAAAADLLRAQVGAKTRDPQAAIAAVNKACRELAELVMRRGIDASREVFARETHMLARELARLRLRLLTTDETQAESLAVAHEEVAGWIDELLTNLRTHMSYDKKALHVLGLNRRIHALRAGGLSESIRGVGKLIREGKRSEAAAASYPLIRPFLEAEFTMRSGSQYAQLTELREQVAAITAAQRTLQAELKEAGKPLDDVAAAQASLRDQLVLAALPEIPAPRASLFDLSLLPQPPSDELRLKAEAAMAKALADIRAGSKDAAVSSQADALDALTEFGAVLEVWSRELAQMSLGVSADVSAATDRVGVLEAIEAQQIALLVKTEEAALEEKNPPALLEDQLALLKEVGLFREELSGGDQQSKDKALPLTARLEVVEQHMKGAIDQLKANKGEEALESQDAAANALAEAREIAADQLTQLNKLQALIGFRQAVAKATAGMADVVGGQNDLIAATKKADEKQLEALLAPQNNLLTCLSDIAPSLDLVAARLDVGTPLVFAASDVEDALIAMEDGDAEDAAEIQEVAVESLTKVQGLVGEIALQTGYVAEIVEYLNAAQTQAGFLAFRQRQLREGGGEEALAAQQQLASEVAEFCQVLTEVAGNVDFDKLDEATKEKLEGLDLSINFQAPAAAAKEVLQELKGGQDATEAMTKAEASLRTTSEQMGVIIEMLNGLPTTPVTNAEPPELHRLIDVLDVAAKHRELLRQTNTVADKDLPGLEAIQKQIADKLGAFRDGETGDPALAAAHDLMTPALGALKASSKADALKAQVAADTALRHFIIQWALILNTATPPATSSDSDVLTESETDDLYQTEISGFVADFVDGEAPKDQESEWEILGERNRAALNQNFARELPLEYRATLKNYYERVAK